MKKFLAVTIVVLALWSVVGIDAHPAPRLYAQALQQAAQKPTTLKPEAAQPTEAAPKPASQEPPRQTQIRRPVTTTQPKTQNGTKRVVDFEADEMRPIKLANDSTALSLKGKVVFYHNGAVIQCDSAVRYSDKRMECFNNVVINKQKTYVYGDRADYNGDINTARVYSPLIKIIDDDVVMHTYNFAFNTLTNVGHFSGRGTVRQKGNLLESNRGYYYSDTRRVVCVDKAELRNEDYRMRSDSMSYDMNTEMAEFYVKSYIWNQNDEILSALRGLYDKADSSYHFTRDSYILTKTQELWSDTLHYNSKTEDAVLHHNIQIRDDEHSSITFGDYGLYWGKREEAMLTLDPQALNFDVKNPEDTLYIRSDSMFLYTVSRESALQVQQIAEETTEEELITAPGRKQAAAERAEADTTATDAGLEHKEIDVEVADTLAAPATAAAAMASLDAGNQPLSPKEQRAREKELKRAKDQAEKKLRDEARAHERAEKDKARGRVTLEAHEHEHPGHADSVAQAAAAARAVTDSLQAIARADSVLAAGRAKADSLLKADKAEKQDSMVRVTRAYYHVRMFRNDFQAVCDSLVAFSIDSTAHMYINPVMWNGLNQIKSDVIDLYSKNQELTKAVYTGTPIMSSEVDTTRYNQVKGKVITARFRNNEIFRNDVDGNAETYYYMTEKDSLGYEYATGFQVIESASISFDIEERQVIRITWRGQPVFAMYPLDKIPEDQPQRLPGFEWEIHRKPTREEVFTRSVRPSQREEYEAMPEPTFPITDQILKHRAQMIKDGMWRDRNDTLHEQALQFIRSLGY